MLTIRMFPAAAIIRLPGPPPMGSRKSRVTWGVREHGTDPDVDWWSGGVPGGDEINTWTASHGFVPAWFAISDGGAGFLPWGFLQVAIYNENSDPAHIPADTPSFISIQVVAGEPSAAVVAAILGRLAGWQATNRLAYPNVLGFRFSSLIFNGQDGDGLTGQLTIIAPYGCSLQTWYMGPPRYDDNEQEMPMVQNIGGWDNPLMPALWGPGQRGLIRLVGALLPDPYPGYPYPSIPDPDRPPIG